MDNFWSNASPIVRTTNLSDIWIILFLVIRVIVRISLLTEPNLVVQNNVTHSIASRRRVLKSRRISIYLLKHAAQPLPEGATVELAS